MKPVALLVAALVLALGVGVFVSGGPLPGQPAFAAGDPPVPEATKKKTPKATKKATASPTPSPSRASRRPVDEEGERWVQIAVVAGGGLLTCVLAFFGIGALLRRRVRPRGD